jgi:hypothetical protein
VGSAVRRPTGEIHVSGAPVEKPVSTVPADKAPSAKDKMFQELRKKAGPTEGPAPVQPQKPAAAPKPAEAAPVSGASDDQGATAGAAADPPLTPGQKKKMSPWKLVEEYKRRLLDTENRYAEVTKGLPSEDQRKAQQAEYDNLKRHTQELEEEIRFQNYSKHPEFKKNYQEPYEKSWNKAMKEMSGIQVTDPTSGEARAVDANDMLMLVNMELGPARDAAEQMFGKFADDALVYRKEIRDLFERQQGALEEARKGGATREEQRRHQFMEYQANAKKMIDETWDKANESIMKDDKFGKFFKPVEGDDEWNNRLEKGYELADKAFGENPYAYNLKPEERQAIIRRHAAVRNRAAAFGGLTHRIAKLEAALAERDEKLKQYEDSTPPTGAAPGAAASVPAGDAKHQMLQKLRQLAK